MRRVWGPGSVTLVLSLARPLCFAALLLDVSSCPLPGPYASTFLPQSP